MKIDKQKLIDDIKRVTSIINKPPSKKEYKEIGNYGVSTISRNFGTWNKALKEVLGFVNVEHGETLQEIICLNCKKNFMPNSSSQKYCSQSCAATASNLLSPKRKKSKICKTRGCQELIFSSHTYCPKCIEERNKAIENSPLSKFIKKRKDANRFSQVRENARRKLSNEKQECQNCKYSKHVQVCHIKPIKSFSHETLVKEVNDRSNLILLCPNCHWELDHGLLKVVGAVGLEPTTSAL